MLGAGVDSLYGTGGNDILDGGAGADLLDGGNGTDTADYRTRTVAVVVRLDGVANDGVTNETDNAKVENVWGGGAGDILTGDAGMNELRGGGGDDTLDGANGADSLVGEGGIDTATYATRLVAVTVTLDGQANDGGTSEGDNVVTENVTGGKANDTITGDALGNVLRGGAGADSPYGLDRDDVLYGDAGNDVVLDGGVGTDWCIVGADGGAIRDCEAATPPPA